MWSNLDELDAEGSNGLDGWLCYIVYTLVPLLEGSAESALLIDYIQIEGTKLAVVGSGQV